MRVEARRGGVQKADILKWANDQNYWPDGTRVDMRTKTILKELASFAGEDCCAWAQIATLEWAANCVDRTVQRCLEKLLEHGLIERTARSHRLAGSTRSVPIYRLAPHVEGLGKPVSMGEKMSPIDEVWVTSGAGMGDTSCHPHRVHGDQESSDELSQRAGESAPAREILISEIEAAMHRRMVAVSDRAAYRAALDTLADEGVDLAVMPGCLRHWGEDPLFVGRKVPVPFEKWLASGQWRASLIDEAPVVADGPGEPEHLAAPGEVAIWLAVMAQMQTKLGAGPFGSYLGRASLGQVGDQLFVVASSTVARDWIRNNCRADLQAAWGRHDPLGRELTLVSKSEFEALMRQGS